jgi:hypothetical protein
VNVVHQLVGHQALVVGVHAQVAPDIWAPGASSGLLKGVSEVATAESDVDHVSSAAKP